MNTSARGTTGRSRSPNRRDFGELIFSPFLSVEDIKATIFQLPIREFMVLVDAIEERAETIAMMQLAETGFREWNEEGDEETLPEFVGLQRVAL